MAAMQHETIVVSGGAGFIGSHLVSAFLDDGHRVVVIDDLSSGSRANLPQGVELHVLDIRSPEAVDLVQTVGATVLCHQAAQIDVGRSCREPRFDADVNIGGLLNLVEAGRRAALRRVLFASSGGTVYGDQVQYPAREDDPTRPLSPYGASKLAAEQYLYYYHREHGLDATCLRYSNVYGPKQSPHGEAGVVAIFISRLLAGQAPLIFGDGEQTRDYVYVHDVVEANRAALGCRGFHIYNVGTGVETSVNTIAKLLAKRLPGAPASIYEAERSGEQRRSSISPARLHSELGIAPDTLLAEGLDSTVGWFAAGEHSPT
jgi:UDP-glucose 4-epimerase